MTRGYECGKRVGKAIIEMAHLFYQLDTKKRFYRGLTDALKPEVEASPAKYDRKTKVK